jgi:ATP-binding cassette, subfamily B, bacterial
MRLRGRGEPAHAAKGTMRYRVNLLLGKRRRSVLALAICSIFSGFTESGTLALIAQIATTLVSGRKEVHFDHGPIHVNAPMGTLVLVAFGLVALRLLLQLPLSKLPSRIASDVQATMRTSLFDAFTHASWSVQSQDREGQLQETATSQVMSASGGALQATSLITYSLTFLVLLASAIVLNPIAAVTVAIATVALFGLLRPLRARGVRNSRALSNAQVEFAGGLAESIRVAEESHVFGVAGAQRGRIAELTERAREFYYRTQLLNRLVINFYQSLIYLLLVGGIAGLVAVGRSHAGALAAVVLLLVRAGTAGQLVQGAYQGLAQSLPFIERTQGAVERYNASAPSYGDRRLPRVEDVAFERVSFSYNADRPVLSDISFEVSGSEAIGIIGPSGAGKSTLVQLLLQLRTPARGRYLINGISADEFAREDWYRQVSYVPQEPRLLHASVADNIRFFRDIDLDAVERAAKLARIHDDVVGWRDGYETIVGPRADAVSGGQQQRICLARALAARPEVLVLDEPTSALDPHSEMLIGESLTALKSELTLFIIAHRMSTLEICDRVMVIVDGRLVAFDTKALLQTQNTYYRHASQLAAGSTGR